MKEEKRRKQSLEVLVSCMNQTDDSLVERSRITTDVLLVNQCGQEGTEETVQGGRRIRRIDTRERGLSRSRNMAVEHAEGDLCLLCDDDEVFLRDYAASIRRAFARIPQADIIIFRMTNYPCKLKKKIHRLRYLQCCNVSSWQIAFRRTAVVNSGVRFSPFMGAGSGNGCGEENKFLMDCYRKGLKIYHYPKEIASVAQERSTWFDGYDRGFFYRRGIATRYMLGLPLSVLYAFYYALRKREMYRRDISARAALAEMLRGIWNNDIHKEEMKVR